MGGPLVGTYYVTPPQFGSIKQFTRAGVLPTIQLQPSTSELLIYKIDMWNWEGAVNPPESLISGVTFSGVATMANDQKLGYGPSGFYLGPLV